MKQNTNNPAKCANPKRLTILNGETPNSDAMLSAALAAHMAGRRISGFVGVCHDGLGKVSAIYIEES
ncbi:hypothetical protein [Pseudoalteromonas luteoviolacea]|uniref:hypothetical protein n=1 Tax=Pseudoalteromonas luteoviolacea TaxID=43657 RepID=UPI0012DA9802|nr:hypothetical protein [Pseudoalteromonas luteoviolacea]